MAKYAANTSVPADRSRAEIEKTLSRYGADQFAYGWQLGSAMIGFRLNGRQVRFMLPMPDKQDPRFQTTPTGRQRRNAVAIEEAWEQETRSRWRALALVIKAKLEAVESGIAEFEEEFLAYIVLPNSQTVGQWILPEVETAYATNRMPRLLPLLESTA